jgi:hypothetical protein
MLDAGLNPLPPQRWHFTFLSPSLISPLPSQLLHFTFFLAPGFIAVSLFCADAYASALEKAMGARESHGLILSLIPLHLRLKRISATFEHHIRTHESSCRNYIEQSA